MDSEESWDDTVQAAWQEAVNFSDYHVPPRGFTSFNGFFTREIISSLRPITAAGDASVAVSPADGYVWLQEDNLQPGSSFQLKRDVLDVQEMLGYHPLHTKFLAHDKQLGGSAVINFLDTPNYHRFWAPVSGVVVAAGQLGGVWHWPMTSRLSLMCRCIWSMVIPAVHQITVVPT